MTEDENVVWHHQLNGHEFEQLIVSEIFSLVSLSKLLVYLYATDFCVSF